LASYNSPRGVLDLPFSPKFSMFRFVTMVRIVFWTCQYKLLHVSLEYTSTVVVQKSFEAIMVVIVW